VLSLRYVGERIDSFFAMAVPDDSVALYAATRLRDLLKKARRLKTTTDIEPPLPPSDFQGELGLRPPPAASRSYYFAAAEDVARHVYQECAASTPIQDRGFVQIWNLFDILSVCGDQEQCDPCLVWWLIEELLETQNIDGCRVVFDYLESRRERLVVNHFEKKNLVILRAFNELLRRLSRAEEAVFCGRVFVFLFQSFPLGARSSVNLKGDFHKENLTTFESKLESQVSEGASSEDAMTGVETAEAVDTEEADHKSVSNSPALATEALLYPAFWTMQEAFSNPPEYFFKQNRMEEFKTTLEATLAKFREVPKVNQAAADGRGAKRDASEVDNQDGFATTFNPKYLTSRELFSLELSDLAFQRHILVQALILLDFLLSLTEKAKKRLTGFPNKSLHFDYILSQSDVRAH
jgi:THO complex subunit 1